MDFADVHWEEQTFTVSSMILDEPAGEVLGQAELASAPSPGWTLTIFSTVVGQQAGLCSPVELLLDGSIVTQIQAVYLTRKCLSLSQQLDRALGDASRLYVCASMDEPAVISAEMHDCVLFPFQVGCG